MEQQVTINEFVVKFIDEMRKIGYSEEGIYREHYRTARSFARYYERSKVLYYSIETTTEYLNLMKKGKKGLCHYPDFCDNRNESNRCHTSKTYRCELEKRWDLYCSEEDKAWSHYAVSETSCRCPWGLYIKW